MSFHGIEIFVAGFVIQEITLSRDLNPNSKTYVATVVFLNNCNIFMNLVTKNSIVTDFFASLQLFS
jgi:hypothetical protein